MKLEVIHGRELSDADFLLWKRLQAANPALESPYFSPGFTRAVAAARDDVRVAVLHDGNERSGFFPFQKEGFGRGRPVGGPLSDYQGVVAASNEGWDAAAVVRAAGLKSWEFDHLICAQTSFAPYHSATCESPVMDLSQGYEVYAASRHEAGEKPFARLATLRRKLEREVAPLRFEAHTTDIAVLRAVKNWKTEQCLQSGGVDVFGARWTNDLIERILHTDDDGFAGSMSALFAGDELIAGHFGMRSRSVWHWWFPTYNHEYSKFSPGLLLLLEMARAAPGLGISTIDLGKGDSTYKSRMRSRGVLIAEGRIEIPSVVHSVRRLRDRAEAWLKTSRFGAPARYPGRVFKRFERWKRFQ